MHRDCTAKVWSSMLQRHGNFLTFMCFRYVSDTETDLYLPKAVRFISIIFEKIQMHPIEIREYFFCFLISL